MSLNDAGTLVSNFWMSYMVGMWAFSFILRFFDLQRILTVLAGLAAILMYVFNTGNTSTYGVVNLALGFFSSAIYTPSSPWVHSRPKYRRQNWLTLS
ncbi:major facilitator superfamily protein [Escherichia coli]|uniref:Major facilitator superfamily protein n=1 Tax=Escherichia coli TaxID=562 RepID=A0A376Y1D6_ECOLX|nr:major facilitator superfamily protein [Escherichia coli]